MKVKTDQFPQKANYQCLLETGQFLHIFSGDCAAVTYTYFTKLIYANISFNHIKLNFQKIF